MCTSSLSVRYLLSALAAAALLAGCGSQAQVSPSGPMQNPALSAHAPIAGPAVKGHCPAHGGVRVDPCSVSLTASNTSESGTVRRPHDKKGSLSESDNCSTTTGTTTTTIATVTLDTSTNTWTVTAGTTAGSCTATFDYTNKRGKVVGWGDLNITNTPS